MRRMKSDLLRGISGALHHGCILFRRHVQVIEIIRIHRTVLMDDLIMEMRARGLSRISGLSYALSPLHLHSLGHSDCAHMGISCLVAEAVVYEDGISISEEFEAHALHHTVTGRIYRIARLESEIYAAMFL